MSAEINIGRIIFVIGACLAIGGFIYMAMHIRALENDKSLYKNKYKSLQQNYSNLETQYQSLQSNYHSLQTELSTLQSKYNSLNMTYRSLQNQHQTLQGEYNQLQSNYRSLESDYNTLQSDHNDLENQYNSLIDNRDKRKGIKNIQEFITPNDGTVKSKLQDILESSSDGNIDENDIYSINNWVHSNIQYNSDTDILASKGNVWGDCWLYPSETLNRNRGDCEDQAILLNSLLNAEQNVNFVWCANLNIDGTGHMVVFINVEDDHLHIIDPTNGYVLPYSMPEQEAISTYAQQQYGGSPIQIQMIFNHNSQHRFYTNQQFYDYF